MAGTKFENLFAQSIKFGGILLLCSGTIFLILAVIFTFKTKQFKNNATLAEGVVIELSKSASADSAALHPVFEFSDSYGVKHRIHSTSGSYPPKYEVGERVAVLYDRDNPKEAKTNDLFSIWFFPLLFFAVISIIHLILGFVMVYFSSKYLRKRD